MVQKKLQKNSAYNELDLDGDGVVSDSELAVVDALSKHEKVMLKEEWLGFQWFLCYFLPPLFSYLFFQTRGSKRYLIYLGCSI